MAQYVGRVVQKLLPGARVVFEYCGRVEKFVAAGSGDDQLKYDVWSVEYGDADSEEMTRAQLSSWITAAPEAPGEMPGATRGEEAPGEIGRGEAGDLGREGAGADGGAAPAPDGEGVTATGGSAPLDAETTYAVRAARTPYFDDYENYAATTGVGEAVRGKAQELDDMAPARGRTAPPAGSLRQE